jgi:hypothetical protein
MSATCPVGSQSRTCRRHGRGVFGTHSPCSRRLYQTPWGILRSQLLPESRVVLLIELREPLILHHLADLLGRVSLLVHFFQQYAINLFGFIRACLHELYGHIRMLLLRETEYLVPFFLPATDPLPKLSGPCGRPSKNPSQNWKRRKEL